jgi:hypothetical protein
MRAAARGFDARPIATAVIAVLTLAPGGAEVGISPWCLTCGDRGLADLLLNVLLFAPLGAALAARGASPRRALLLGLAFSLGIEVLQLLIPGRAPTARDVLTNGFGCWLGARAFLSTRAWAVDSAHGTRRALAFVLLLGLGFAGLRWLDTPAQLRSYHWTQRRPLLGDAPRWPGLLLDVSLGSTPLPEGRLTPEHPLRDLLNADSTLHLKLVAAGPTAEWMPIVGIVDSWRVHLALLGQEGDDLRLRLGRRATYFLLETPEILFPDALRDVPRDSAFMITLRGIADGRPCLSVLAAATSTTRCATATTPGSVWTLFLPSAPRVVERRQHPLDALTLAVLLLPLGLALHAMPRRRAVLAAGLMLAALVAWTRLLGFAWPSLLELPAMPLGLAAGAWIGRRLARSGNVADHARPDELRDGERQSLPDAHR